MVFIDKQIDMRHLDKLFLQRRSELNWVTLHRDPIHNQIFQSVMGVVFVCPLSLILKIGPAGDKVRPLILTQQDIRERREGSRLPPWNVLKYTDLFS